MVNIDFDYIVKRETLYEKINKALDNKNKNDFLKLSKELNNVMFQENLKDLKIKYLIKKKG